ncbi:MAG: lyase family protein [Planctomycetota bacterium]
MMPDSPSPHDRYASPLAGRYASAEMQSIWSARRKFELWRKIWLAVAEAQHEMGLPVTREQVEELRANLDVTDDDIAAAAKYEKELRHDVMAHVHAWGDRCPKARGIIHLGMTSQDINDNCELLLLHHAWDAIRRRTEAAVVAWGMQAEKWKGVPTLGFTHYQPAQPTTVGRRCAQWGFDVAFAADESQPDHALRLRGIRGATGTQASFLNLLDGDADAVTRLDALVLYKLRQLAGEEDPDQTLDEFLAETRDDVEGLIADTDLETEEDRDALRTTFMSRVTHEGYVDAESFRLTGQTYPRVFDAILVARLSAIAAVLHKIANDIRLLCNRKEIDEPFADKQIGSSAMPYKRNPMRCERICGLARFVMNLVPNAYDTAATQWLERTLDDSSNRRLVLPEAFLALDACLGIMHNVASGIEVHEATVRKNLMAELPFMATENIMMEAVGLGRDRQEVHEAIRMHSQAAGARVKNEGADNDLIERLRNEPLLEGVDLDAQLDPMKYVGLSVEQTERFVAEVIEPLREQNEGAEKAQDLDV